MGKMVAKILIIDDNEENSNRLELLIKDAFPDTAVCKALIGEQGLELAAAEAPDVIFLDINMHGMDGFEVCTQLKANKVLSDTPVVFVANPREDKENYIQALECGADAVLLKPIEKMQITTQIRAMLKIRATNIKMRDEKQVLAALIEEKTKDLKNSNNLTQQLFEGLMLEGALIEAIFESRPGFLYVYDENGKMIKWSKKHETMTGYSTKELSQMTLEKWFDQKELVRVKAAVRDVFEKGYCEVEAQMTLKNGNKMMTRSSGVPLIIDGHKYFVGIGIDITEQEQAQQSLLESQAILKAAFDNSLEGIAIADAPDGKLRYVNKSGLLDREKSREEIVNNTDIHNYVDNWGMLHLNGNPFAEEEVPLARAILYGEPCSAEFMIRKDDYEDRYILTHATPITDSNNNINAGIAIFLDITERKKKEVQLKQSMDDLLESQRIAQLGTWRLDLDTNQIVWSDELRRMYGLDPTIPTPPFLEHLKLFTPGSWDKLSTSLERIKDTGIPSEHELEFVNKDGSNEWVWTRVEAVKEKNGKITGLWGVVQNITERKKYENTLLYLNNHDHLTGLYNRKFFEEELRKLDTIENLPLSIIMFDINGLKLANDSFGYASGDMLLKKAAVILKNVCREKDLIARIGGDEFIVLLPRTSEAESIKIANQVKEQASKEIVSNFELSISYGYDTKTTDKQSIVETIANSENYMYRRKLYAHSSTRSKTINLIMNALFEKSHREAAHSNRVGNICMAIASKMNMDKDSVNQMKAAGLIHDIGKIGIDEKILNKRGFLTINERMEIERHPEIGWRILSSTDEFSELAQFVLKHHEKWDGSGYPNGLKGEAIQFEARIISVADAYDAMTSARSYRKGLSKEEAIIELMRCSGTQFDPNIVNVFVNQVISAL